MQLGLQLGFWAVIPFALMLVAVAVLPLAAGRWYAHNRNKAIVAAVLGAPTVLYLLFRFGHPALVAAGQTGKDYVSFMVLLLALFTISGGIHLSGDIRATPWTNLLFLGGAAVLANVIYNPKKRQVTPERITRAVADYYGVHLDALKGQKRDKAIVVPRQIAMFLMREETDVSLLRIGAELGGRDHSTVLHACDKINREMGINDELRRELAAVRELIYAD